MKIVLAMTQALFIKGGAEYHVQNLKNALIKAGHDVDTVNIPMMDNPVELLEKQIVATRLLEIERTWAGMSDLCIGLKFPAYFLRHSNKVIWAMHQYQAAYDHWGASYNDMHLQPEGARIKDIIINADNLYLREAKRVYASSKHVANKMQKYNDINAQPLYHPCPDMDGFYDGGYDNYILMPSRINSQKRQRLAIDAMAYTKSDIKLVITGKADNEFEADNIRQYVRDKNLEKKVQCQLYDYKDEKTKLYANARAVLFIPMYDAYGYITLEAMSASKAIITCKDSGGPLEFVVNNKTGFVVDPNPVEIAMAIDELANSISLARELGKTAKKHITNMDISWDNVVKELTR